MLAFQLVSANYNMHNPYLWVTFLEKTMLLLVYTMKDGNAVFFVDQLGKPIHGEIYAATRITQIPPFGL